jgi:hypothetical protein
MQLTTWLLLQIRFPEWGLSVIEVSATKAVERPLTDPQRPLAAIGRNDKSCPEADLYVEFGSSHSRQRWGRQSAASDRSRSWVFSKSKSTGFVMNSAAPYSLARRRRSSSP